jgi:hypothetical protein
MDPSTPDVFHNLNHSQAGTGWDQLHHGCFPTWQMEAHTFEADQLGQQQPKASKGWLVGIIEIAWRHIMELWESRNEDKHGINADKEVKAKRLLMPWVRGLCEQCSHLPLNATETLLDADLATREKQTTSTVASNRRALSQAARESC